MNVKEKKIDNSTSLREGSAGMSLSNTALDNKTTLIK